MEQLPEKWCVQSNINTDEIIRTWFNKEFNLNIDGYKAEKGWIYKNYYTSSYIEPPGWSSDDTVQLSFEDFQILVLNQIPIINSTPEDLSYLIDLFKQQQIT